MMSFSKDTNFSRLTPTRIASYSVSLLDSWKSRLDVGKSRLDAGKSSRMACSIISPVGALSCKPTPAPIWREAHSTLRIHQPSLFGSISG